MGFLSYYVLLHAITIIYKCDNSLLLPISTNLSLLLDITLVISLSKEINFIHPILGHKRHEQIKREKAASKQKEISDQIKQVEFNKFLQDNPFD